MKKLSQKKIKGEFLKKKFAGQKIKSLFKIKIHVSNFVFLNLSQFLSKISCVRNKILNQLQST